MSLEKVTTILKFLPNSGRIGLLGGSFNPAHSGHVHISNEALTLMNLDIVLWLVSPQNPMKPDMALSLQHRLKYAKFVASQNSKIVVSDVEKLLPTSYTSNTIKALKDAFPGLRFAWIMGADNMVQVHKWHNWQSIFDSVFVAVFDRAEYAEEAIESEAGKCYKSVKCDSEQLEELYPGFWKFFRTRKSPLSSTLLRRITSCDLKLLDMKDIFIDLDYIKDMILNSLDHDHGEDIKVYDISKKSGFAKYMIITTGKSNRHVVSMIENLIDKLKKINIPTTTSGLDSANWVLLDAGDIVVNAFLPEYRTLYNLDDLWG